MRPVTLKMIQYRDVVQGLVCHFHKIIVSRLPREDNFHADVLSGLAPAANVLASRSVLVELLDTPSIAKVAVVVLSMEASLSWIDPLTSDLRDGSLPNAGAKAHKLKIRSTHFCLIDNKLYWKSYQCPCYA